MQSFMRFLQKQKRLVIRIAEQGFSRGISVSAKKRDVNDDSITRDVIGGACRQRTNLNQ
jgi:hypothetical protein